MIQIFIENNLCRGEDKYEPPTVFGGQSKERKETIKYIQKFNNNFFFLKRGHKIIIHRNGCI